MYRELFHALMENGGGSLVTFSHNVRKRTRLANFFPPDTPLILPARLRTPQPRPAPAMASTGPP